ncbi:TIGR04282 family arsenosugar biosynthesis glycosyltransferase [Rhodohalobacter barkolensis]|uniref:TIGR04282 family arsenosugar biosynthesis glycosyltransferase n=1 Tax=Rhodohalobacter barkolensis TaxID=2053187 RepID=UPI0013FD643C|nr:TIGR04282 family arsenosugar biosynthesis glycosyltransferase [Rhodohalobacter barkolensis]
MKTPEKGRVKTRLAASVGDDKALNIYKKLLDITAETAAGVHATKRVSYSKSVVIDDQFDVNIFEKTVQSNGDLGRKMKSAIHAGFEQGFKRVILIGSDCPGISSNLIDDAFDRLKSVDCTIGPSDDGGYYLIGMSRFLPEIFDDIEWSTNSVCETTIEKLEESGATYSKLTVLNDIDTESDLMKSDLRI